MAPPRAFEDEGTVLAEPTLTPILLGAETAGQAATGPHTTRETRVRVNTIDDPGTVVRIIIGPADEDTLETIGGPLALTTILTEAVERLGLDELIHRLEEAPE